MVLGRSGCSRVAKAADEEEEEEISEGVER
jgi:hypothetical protein